MITRSNARPKVTETLVKRQEGCEQLHNSAIQKSPFILISYLAALPLPSVSYEKTVMGDVEVMKNLRAFTMPRHD